MRIALNALGFVLPEPGAAELSVDVRAEWPGAPERLARTDRVCQLAMLAAHRALGDVPAGARPWAVVHASALASLTTNLRYYDKVVRRGARFADPKRFPYTSPNAAAGEVAIAFGLVGPNVTLASGGAAGLEALAVAARLVTRGRAPAALVVVADAWSVEVADLLDRAGIERGEGIREGSVALLLGPEQPGSRLAIAEIVTGHGPAAPGPWAPAVAPLSGLRDGSASTLTVRCPLSGNRALVRLARPTA